MPDIHPRDEHSWFRARLDPQALGLLDEEEEKRFLEHARACEGCAAAMKAHRENLPLGGPDIHIPPHIIARWDRASRRLEGLPRKMFREHLEHCAACRQDLVALGFTPSLPLDPELERGEDDPMKPTLTTAEVALKQPDRQVLIVKRYSLSERDRWRGWALGGVAGAALATAAAVLILPNVARERAITTSPLTRGQAVPRGPSESPEQAPAIPREPVDKVVMDVVPPVVALLPATRAGESPEAHLEIRGDQRFIQLGVPDLYVPDTTVLRATLRDERGALLLDMTLRYGELTAGRTLLVGNPRLPFTPGLYRLVLTPAVGAGAPPIEFRMRVERAR
jgi:hypothetical protein